MKGVDHELIYAMHAISGTDRLNDCAFDLMLTKLGQSTQNTLLQFSGDRADLLVYAKGTNSGHGGRPNGLKTFSS